MKRWVVVSQSSLGHIRANGSLHHSDTHTHKDTMTHFCLRGCGILTLNLSPEREEEEEERVNQRGGQRNKE